MGLHVVASNAAGSDLAAVLPADPRPWWRQRHLLALNSMLFCAMLFSSTIGYDNSMMNGLQSLAQWQTFMHHPKGAYLGGINAIQAGGSFLGYPGMAIIANRFGRKTSVYLGCAIISFGVALQTAAQNPAMFIASRFVIGTSSGFLGAVPLLVTETAFPTHRGKMTAGYNTLYYVGSLIAAWATFGTREMTTNWAWRIPSLLQISIPVICIGGFILCPESPRWLIAKGRHEEARRIFIKYHAGGNEHSPLVEYEMIEVQQAIEMEAANHRSTSYLDMFKTKGNRHRLIISVSMGVFAQWNGVGVVSYYLSSVLKTVGVTSVTQQTLINGFLQVWNLIIAVTAAGLVDRLGRRFLLLTSSFGMLVCYIVITGLSGSFAQTQNSATGLAVIPMLFIYYGFYDIAYTPLVIAYPAEIWPYHLRSRGVAVTLCSTFLALFFNLFVNPIALSSIAWRYYIVYVAILVGICLTAWFFYPETKGRSLEDMAAVFDGEDAEIPAKGAVLSAVEEKMPKSVSLEHVEYMADNKV